MSALDYVVLALYFAGMLGVGLWFHNRQTGLDEYFVGGRKMGSGHIGFSIVATDVGGGFSIGLGGLGFLMGLSASWLLFTGLVGAWLAAVLLVPRVRGLKGAEEFRSFPDLLAHRFDERTRKLAALVTAIGYGGFTGSQLLAGGKLAAAAFGIDIVQAVVLMSVVIVAYTALGGLEAVVYTDTVQWGILLFGLTFIALPLGWQEVGGLAGLRAELPPEFLTLTNVSWTQITTWIVTIVPIWFVAMTLHQRVHACRDAKTAKRAFFIAGLLEYPFMAFIGAALGMFARVLYPGLEAEMGLPTLVREVLPLGLTGLVLAAYLAAIMSTADSCLLASVGSLVDDLFTRLGRGDAREKSRLRLVRGLTLVIGFSSVGFALLVPTVIESILLAYSFMVAGLFVPTLAALFWPRAGARAAFWSMLSGGSVTVVLAIVEAGEGAGILPEGMDPIFPGLAVSALVLLALGFISLRSNSAQARV